MTLAAMLKRAGGLTLAVYAIHTLSAALLNWPLNLELASKLAAVQDSRAAALLLEVAVRQGSQLRRWVLPCIAGYLLLQPAIAMSWLHAMLPGNDFRTSLQRGFDNYAAALVLAACALLLSAAPLGLGVLALRYGPPALPASITAEGFLRAFILCATWAAVFSIATIHDLARAALATAGVGPLAALARGMRRFSVLAFFCHASAAATVVCLFSLAEIIGRVAQSFASIALTLAPQQALVFLATCCRGAWLAVSLQTQLERIVVGDATRR